MTKYHAKKTSIDGYTFDSLAEANRYQQLKLLKQAGEIDELAVHPSFDIVVNGCKVCKYIADFYYFDHQKGEHIVEDVKGVKTAVYRLKKKLMKAVHGIDIYETG